MKSKVEKVVQKHTFTNTATFRCHLLIFFSLKVTYHENLTFPGFKCYNQVPSASTNQGNVKKINPVTLF